MIEKIIFNVLAFTLFILMFIQLIRKNDTSYVYLLVYRNNHKLHRVKYRKKFWFCSKIDNVHVGSNLAGTCNVVRIQEKN